MSDTAFAGGSSRSAMVSETSINTLASEIHERINTIETNLEGALSRLSGGSVPHQPEPAPSAGPGEVPNGLSVLTRAVIRLARLQELASNLNRVI
jgi:hypothetical protein